MLVRCVFLLIAPAVLVQYALVRGAGEPYPALMMPGFPGSGGWSDGKLELRKVDIVMIAGSGREFTFTHGELLRDFNAVFQLVIVENYFSPLDADQLAERSETPKSKLKQLGRKLLPRLHGGKRHRTAPENVAALADWTRRQAARLLPGETIVRAEFRWFTTTVGSDHAQPPSARVPLGTYVVSLDESRR